MNRITISVTEEIDQAIKREARRQGCSVSAVARVALGNHLHLVVDPNARRKLDIIGIASGDGSGWSERVDEILAEEWGDPDFDRDS